MVTGSGQSLAKKPRRCQVRSRSKGSTRTESEQRRNRAGREMIGRAQEAVSAGRERRGKFHESGESASGLNQAR